MSRFPISLDRPVGNSEDSHFGDLLPDGEAENPATGQTINHNVTVLTILNVVTLDDTPPALIGENTTGGTVANVKPASFDLVTRLNEPGRVWYVVTPHVAPAVAVYWNDTCFDRYSHAYFKPVSADFKLNQPPLPHIGLLDPREHEYVCPSEDAVDSGLGDRVRWIGAPTVEEVMMGVGPNRTQAAACGYVDVPTANVEVTKTIASVFDPSAEVDRCANWTAAYDENVTGGVYTAMDDRAASEAENDGRRGVGDMWVYGWYHGEYLIEDYTIGNWSKWVANASDLPAYPEHPTCRTCPRLSPEGAYDVWIVAEDDGTDPKRGAEVVEKMATQHGCDIAFGTLFSHVVIGSAPRAGELKIPYFVVSEGHHVASGMLNRYTLQPGITDVKSQVQAMAPFVNSTLGKKVTMIYPDFAFGHDHRDYDYHGYE